MKSFLKMNREELLEELAEQKKNFEACKAKGLKLDMSRGRPSKLQLDVAKEILTSVQTAEDCMDGSIDARN